MKETKFIGQNKSKWEEFESLLDNKVKDPNRLSDLYIQITDDLSYSKTYYKNRLVRAYLNNLSQKIYLSVYKNKKTPLTRFLHFWKEEIPFVVYQCRRELLISFFVFFLAALIGALSVINDPDYAEIVTSPSYVRMTKENIKNNDPMAVYKDEDALNMFLAIAWNNIRVSFYVFASGILAGIGTIIILLLNGTMLGGFQFFFWDKGVFLESVVTVWQHGTIEILCIVIAGGAGIALGKGLIAPGSYPRLQSFQLAARKGLILMISIIPFIIIAAFIEGYITRLTEAPMVFRIGMIALSLLVMFGYFVYYPYQKYQSGFDASLKFEKPVESKALQLSFSKIKDAAEIFADAFSIFTKSFGKFLSFAFIVGIAYGFLHLYYLQSDTFFIDFYDFWNTVSQILENTFQKLFAFFKHSNEPFVILGNILMLGGLLFLSTSTILKFKGDKVFNFTIKLKLLFTSLAFSLIFCAAFFVGDGWSYFLFAILAPIVSILHVAANEEDSIKKGIQSGISVLHIKFVDNLLLWIMLIVIIVLFSFINTSTIVLLVVDFISQNFLMEGETVRQFYTFISAFLGVGVFSLIFPVFFLSFGLHYYAMLEQKTAKNLLLKIERLLP